jgi:hypothetical protein
MNLGLSDILYQTIEVEHIIETSDNVPVEALNKIKHLYKPLAEVHTQLTGEEIILDQSKIKKPWTLFFRKSDMLALEIIDYTLNKVDLLNFKVGQKFFKIDEDSFNLLLSKAIRL